MQNYRQERVRQEKRGSVVGIALTLALHALICIGTVFSGLDYLYPPPPENTFLIDFSEPEPEKPKQVRDGSQPSSEEVDRSKPLEIVRRSEAQQEGTKANKAPEAVVDEHGDVEVKQPPREKPIDRRALFHAADNKTDKDTLAAQTAAKVSDALKAGHASGNSLSGKTDGQPNAHLKGRKVVGSLPKPTYTVQESGIVVVSIWVDQYGTVQKAQAGATGTTASSSKLLQAAREAAMKAHFNTSADAPALQEGTITYIFTLK